MQSRRKFMISLTVAGAAVSVGLPLQAATSGPGIVSATAITRVFGNGVRLVGVALEYGAAIAGSGLGADDYSVEGRTVTEVYTASAADPAARAEAGRFVIVALSPDDRGALLSARLLGQGGPAQGAGGPPSGAGGPPFGAGGPPPGAGGPPPGPGGPGKGGGMGGGMGKAGSVPPNVHQPKFLPPQAEVMQVGEISTVEGAQVRAATQPVATSAVNNLIVDDFRQLEFTDPASGRTLAYNLFIPKGYDPARRYPLVLFMHDAGVASDITETTLLQGLGAVCWASPEDQAKRPCFVVAPQYAEIIADDDSRTSGMLDMTIHLIEALSTQYSIDPARRYATGQSGGCMMSIAMNIKYPDFFAASFLVAGQWDAKLVAPMAGNRLWIVVSQDDIKAFPGQNAITEALEAAGAKVSRATWDGTWSPEQFRFAFDAMDARDTAINYVTFAAGTVIPAGESTQGGAGHLNTWRIAYTIEPIREWIFRQHRPAAG